jgi:hypothetical protein
VTPGSVGFHAFRAKLVCHFKKEWEKGRVSWPKRDARASAS